MRSVLERLRWACVASALAATAALAGTVTGIVRNGTTGTPGAGVDVILIQLQGGMQAVANTKSDAQGRFHFDNPTIGQQPMLLRAVYRGVNYHEPIPPGQTNASTNIEIFEPTQDRSALQVASRAIVVQPSGSTLLVGEEYTIENHSNPPRAYYKEQGSFEFQLPQGGDLAQVAAWGPSGMPVTQGTIDKGRNHYAIAFPFRPGENGVRLSYQMAYASNQATVRVPSLYAAQRVLIVAPPSMQILAEGFAPAGTEQGWNLYSRDSVPAGKTLAISVSGTAPPPSANDAQGASSGGGEAGGEPSGEGAAVLPARLDNLKWILVAGFASLFALGVFFLLQKPRAPVATNAASQATTEVDRAVRNSVEEIKETLFRLELRRQAGTLSEEEYARQRSRAEKALRDLVKG